ncbi:MAG: 4a-hydroxytetrahydrobiopterin dehydratase [Gemmatimonadota bacterium]
MTRLDDARIRERLTQLDGWERAGDAIRKTFTFDGFPDAVGFVDRLVEPAEAADHHPDLDIRYDRVIVQLSTHSEGGLTDKDFDLASKIDALEGEPTV